MKLKKFFIAKEISNQISQPKRQPAEWANIFANETSDKGLMSKTYKEFIQLYTKKKKEISTTTIQLKNGQRI